MRKHLVPHKLSLPVVVALLFFTSLLFLPGIRSYWDYSYRINLLNDFIQNIKENGHLNPQEYWLFRERYSPGSFTFNEQAIEMLQTFRIMNLNESGQTELLYYSGSFINSTDLVTTDPELVKENSRNGEIIIDMENIHLIKLPDNSYVLEFLLPISEMKKANGFFDYLESENKLLENKKWLNKTEIK